MEGIRCASVLTVLCTKSFQNAPDHIQIRSPAFQNVRQRLLHSNRQNRRPVIPAVVSKNTAVPSRLSIEAGKRCEILNVAQDGVSAYLELSHQFPYGDFPPGTQNHQEPISSFLCIHSFLQFDFVIFQIGVPGGPRHFGME